jgi:curved DNA-binding protein CbpA
MLAPCPAPKSLRHIVSFYFWTMIKVWAVMPDYFALLDETRRPWLEPDEVKQKFITRSAPVHPDRIHSAPPEARSAAAKSFAELNAARQHLSEPKLRLLHLLELELGERPKDIQEIPNKLANLFTGVAAACRQADAFLAEKARVTSPLLQVNFFGQGLEWVEKLQQLQQNLNLFHQQLINELHALDESWVQAATAANRRPLLARLEELYRLFGYFNRWNSQIQERIVQLSF